jgi:hypothetical protein
MEPDEIIVNPHAKITPALGDKIVSGRDPGSIDGFLVSAPLRGRPFTKHAIKKAADRGLFDLLYEIFAAGGDLELDLTDAQEEGLLRIGFLAPRRQIPEAVRYRCFLDAGDFADLSVRPSPPPSDRLLVNPSLIVADLGADLEPLRGRGLCTDRFLSGHPMLWVEDPGTSVLAPYWVRGRGVDIAQSLIPGAPAPSNLDPETERCFRAADILAPEDHRERRAAEVERALEEARSQHAERGYGILRDLLPPLQIAAMRRYYRQLIENGHVPLGDGQVEERYFVHDERMAVFWHRQLGRVMSHVVGRPVKPSYCYFAQYEPGAILRRHTDRIQAEYTLSIQVAYEPEIEPGEKTPWPIFVETKGKERRHHAEDAEPTTAELRLAVGEAVFYRGCDLPHYRNELPAGNRSTSFFFHYVHADFKGSLR